MMRTQCIGLLLGIHLSFLKGVGELPLPAATLRIGPALDPQYIQLYPTTEPGKFYMLQSAATLMNPSWADRESIVGTGLVEGRFWPIDGSGPGFYRLKEMASPGAGIELNTLSVAPEFTYRGTWYGSSLPGYNGRSTLFSVELDAVCVWQPTQITPGRYRVHVFFPAHSSNVRQAEYTIISEAGAEVVILDQGANGGRWVRLGGVYSFRPGACSVQLKRATVLGSLRADAIFFEPVLDQEEIRVEAQTGSGEFEAMGEWDPGQKSDGGGSVVFSDSGGAAVCQWRPLEIPYGIYHVHAYLPADLTSPALAEYTIGSLSGVETVTVDQAAHAGQWIQIGGTHRFASGHCYVQLRSAEAGGTVRAGAIRWVPASASEFSDPLPNLPSSLALGSVTPTLFFKNSDPLRQFALLSVLHTGNPDYCRFTVKIGDQVASRHDFGPVFGITETRVEIPDVAEPTSMTFSIESLTDPAQRDSRTMVWRPQKKWKIYLLETAHSDLGYENYVRTKRSYLMDWADEGLGLAEQNTHGEFRQGFHFFFEHLWWFLHYEDEKGPARTGEMLQYIRDGRAFFGGLPTLSHGAWMSGEETARYTYPLRQEIRNRYGITQARAAYYADVDLPAWATAQALVKAGYRGLAMAPSDWRLNQPFQERFSEHGMSPLFYWEMPNGRDRLLTYIGESYGRGLNLHYDYTVSRAYYQRHVTAWLNALEASGYAYDAVLTTRYGDDERPNLNIYPFVEAWNREFRYPEILHNASLDSFFDYFQTNAADLPVYRGELANPWADYAAIDVSSHGAKRHAATLAATGETLATLASHCEASYAYPFAELHKLYDRFNEYNEHSWPTLPAAKDFHVVNTKYLKTQSAREFLEPGAEQIVQESLRSILKHITTAGPTLVVFNPMLQVCTAYAQIATDLLGHEHFDLRNAATGLRVPHQKLADGHTLFLAENVPALGYLTFLVEPRADAPVFPPAVSVSGTTLSNRFYTVHFDASSGSMDSLIDVELGASLVQPGQGLNRYIYRHNLHGQKPEAQDYSPANASLSLEESGPLRAVMRATLHEEQSGADIVQRVMLYRDLKRIDIVNELTGVDAMHQSFSGEPYENADLRYRHNIFYAFPFAVPDFGFHTAGAAGVVSDFADPASLVWANLSDKDFVCVDNWATISGSDYGVTLVSPDAPILHLGEIRYNQRSTEYTPTNAAVYSHVQSSRIGPHNFLQPEDCNHRFRYSITSGRGGWAQMGAPRFGRETVHPLLTGLIQTTQTARRFTAPAKSLLGVKPVNIELSVLKQSEEPGRGLIVRLHETEGRDTSKALLYFNLFPPAAAYLTDLSESADSEIPLSVENNCISFDIAKFDWATIRIRVQGEVPPVTGLSSPEIQDGQVTLRWDRAEGAHGYNVYRSSQNGFRPNAYNRVGYTAAAEFVDRGLSPNTAYYYKVAAVNSYNEEGPPAALALTTDTENQCPPEPVSGFMAMTLPSNNGTIRVAVCWERSRESDIAYYMLYRSTGPDFAVGPDTLVGVVGDTGHYHQLWIDSWGLSPGTTYYYKVAAVDMAENEQPLCPQVKVTTLLR